MEVRYNIIIKGETLTLSLFTINNIAIDSQICVVQTITNDIIKKCGNIIDKKTMPFKICYSVLKEFQNKVSQKILCGSEYIEDETLKDKMVEYTKDILSDKIEIVPEDTFRLMLSEVEKFCENVGF